jgi:hypothetical protein
MGDNLNVSRLDTTQNARVKAKNRGRDRGLVSDEPYEIEYIHQQFPNHAHDEVHKAIQAAKAELKRSEDRSKIMQILRQKLKWI